MRSLKLAFVVVMGIVMGACSPDKIFVSQTTVVVVPSDTTKKDTTKVPTDTTTHPDTSHHTVVVTGVVVDSTFITRPFGAQCTTTFQLKASVLPANAVQTVVWSVTNHGVVSVSPVGLVTLLKAGVDTVRATSTSDSTKKASVVVSIVNSSCVPVNGVTVDSSAITRSFGTQCATTFQLTANVQPANAPQSVIWSSTIHGAVSVSQSGFVTLLKVGVDTIFATSTENPAKKATVVVTVTNTSCAPPVIVSNIVVTPNPISSAKGTTAQLTATITVPAGVSKTVIWYSTGPNIVEVAQKDGDAITFLGQVILANVKGGTIYFGSKGTVQICAQLVADPTVRGCAAVTTQ